MVVVVVCEREKGRERRRGSESFGSLGDLPSSLCARERERERE